VGHPVQSAGQRSLYQVQVHSYKIFLSLLHFFISLNFLLGFSIRYLLCSFLPSKIIVLSLLTRVADPNPGFFL
jgi:hypothetical protein